MVTLSTIVWFSHALLLASVPVEWTKAATSLTFLSDTDCLDIRAGQPDDHLVQMAAAKKEAFKSHNGDSVEHEYAPVRLNQCKTW